METISDEAQHWFTPWVRKQNMKEREVDQDIVLSNEIKCLMMNKKKHKWQQLFLLILESAAKGKFADL